MGRSGALNRRIELWRKTVTKGEYGSMLETWELYKYLRANNHRHYGDEGIHNEEIFNSIKLRVVVRNQSDITEMDRLKVNNILYSIDFIQPDETYRWLHIRCSKINE